MFLFNGRLPEKDIIEDDLLEFSEKEFNIKLDLLSYSKTDEYVIKEYGITGKRGIYGQKVVFTRRFELEQKYLKSNEVIESE